MKKYKLLPKSKNGLHRIEALRNFSNVKKGDIGGYVEKESNLSHYGKCWIYDDAMVFDDALVFGNTKVLNNTRVFGNSRVFGGARVSGNVRIFNNAMVFDSATVFNDAWVFGNARVSNKAMVYGFARVLGDVEVSDCASLFGNIKVSKTHNILTFHNVGSANGILTAILSERDGVIYINRGCFYGDIDEFEVAVKSRHGTNRYGRDYRLLIRHIKSKLSENDLYKAV